MKKNYIKKKTVAKKTILGGKKIYLQGRSSGNQIKKKEKHIKKLEITKMIHLQN